MEDNSRSTYTRLVLGLLPGIAVLLGWEAAGQTSSTAFFFFSSPSQVIYTFCRGIASGELIVDFIYTLLPAVIGLGIGVTLGTSLGFLILASRRLTIAAEWNVLV